MATQQAFSIFKDACRAAIPCGGITVSQWADANRVLSPEASAEPGRWKTARVPYAREWMDVFNDPFVHTVTLMTSSQVAKSETLNNVCGYYIEYDPCPIMFIQPTLDRMKDYSKKRIAPMIRDTPSLNAVVAKESARESDNTMLSKAFVGGHLLMTGANAASALASNPIRVILADEIDRYPKDVDNEGDPLSLAIVRTTTFSNRKIGQTSTPTIKGESRVEEEFELSDKRRYFVPCPHCGEAQILKWDNLKYERESEENENIVSVYYVCDVSGCQIEPQYKLEMIDKGEWIAEKPCNGHAGFHINALYSVWLSWKELAERFVKAKNAAKAGKPELLKVFVNTMLGETWDMNREGAEISGLETRAEEYAAQVPQGVLLLTAGVDVQGDRIECEIVGWGAGFESWSLNYYVLQGNPAEQQIWSELREILLRQYECEREDARGERLQRTVDVACIDSGGHHTQQVYDFTRANAGYNFLAIKGSSTGAKEAIAKRPTKLKGGARLWMVGTSLIKDMLFPMLKVEEAGAGYCHFPTGYDAEYFKQLTAEKRVKKVKKFDKNDPHGYSQWVYKKIRARNEALDCRVYAMAAAFWLNPNFDSLQTEENLICQPVKVIREQDRDFVSDSTRFSARRGVKSGGFVSSWSKK